MAADGRKAGCAGGDLDFNEGEIQAEYPQEA